MRRPEGIASVCRRALLLRGFGGGVQHGGRRSGGRPGLLAGSAACPRSWAGWLAGWPVAKGVPAGKNNNSPPAAAIITYCDSSRGIKLRPCSDGGAMDLLIHTLECDDTPMVTPRAALGI